RRRRGPPRPLGPRCGLTRGVLAVGRGGDPRVSNPLMTRPLPLFFPGGAPTGVGLRRRPSGGGGASSKALVAPSDFTYLGAFRVPASVDYGGSLGVLTTAYTYGGLALR